MRLRRIPIGRSLVIAAGIAMMSFGAWEYLRRTPDLARRVDFAKYLVGSALLHDLVLAPAVCGLGWLLARSHFPQPTRAPLRFAFMASGITIALGLPGIRGTARATANSSIQPLNYASAVLTVLVVVWAIAAVWSVVATRRAHTRLPPRL